MKAKHPDDTVHEAEAVVDAAERWAEWRDQHAAAIGALILTYADLEAERLLAILRERFWSAG